MKCIARELLQIARSLTASLESPSLDGMTKRQATRKVNDILSKNSRGIFSDESWVPVNKIWSELDADGIDYNMTGAEYLQNERGVPTGKQWKFQVSFINEKGRNTILYGTVTASGMGSVSDPLEKYDLVAYCS